MKNKKMFYFLIIGIIFLFIIFFIIFKFFNYKNTKMGNNIVDKTLKEIEEYILNINSYDAEIEVKVESNKNTNKYIIEQKYTSPNICNQKVIEPKNIEGLTVKYDGSNLEITNSKFLLQILSFLRSILWLSDFIEKYKTNGGTITEENGIIIMEVKLGNNKYSNCEKLYIDRNANKITKLVIEDENQKSRIYITYNKIEICSLSKEDVLAFKTQFMYAKDI